MMIKIKLENLPEEYKTKMCRRKLKKNSIARMAVSISERYFLQKGLLTRMGIASMILTCMMLFMSIPSLSSFHVNKNVFFLSFGIVFVFELILFLSLYYIVVTRVPRQFAKCLKKGYPELNILYGYHSLTNGSLKNSSLSDQPVFSFLIENIFELQNCNDIVVTGFADGLLIKNHSVFVMKQEKKSNRDTAVFITGIETKSGHSVSQVSDCFAALRIQNGKDILLTPGMKLYHNETISWL